MSKKRLSIDFPMNFSQVKSVNKTFQYGVCAIAYAGLNRNKSNISKEAFIKSLPTLKNVPLVANYNIETNELGGHDLKIVTNADGKCELVHATTPFGLVPESAKQWWEKIDDIEYLMTEVLLWKRSPATKYIIEQQQVAQSMEINLYDEVGTYQIEADGTCTINIFEFEALCAIGKEPCFEAAHIQLSEEYEKQTYSEQFSLMLNDLKQFNLKEGGLENLVEKIEQTDDIEIAFEVETEQPSNTEIQKDDKQVVSPVKAEFSSSYRKKCNLLENALPKEEYIWGEDDKLITAHSYWLRDFDDNFACVGEETYAENKWDYHTYRWAYEISESDVVTFGEKVEVFSKYLTKEELERFETLEAQLGNLTAQFELYKKEHLTENSEVETLKEFKLKVETEAYQQAVGEIIESFSDLSDMAEFTAIADAAKTAQFNMPIEELEEKCFALRGRRNTTFTKKIDNKKIKLPVNGLSFEHAENPYGNIF